MKNGWKAKLKKTIAGVAVAASLGSVSLPAHAYEGDPWFHFWVDTVYVQFASAVTNQFFGINTYLDMIYTYMISGEGDFGSGIIGGITKHMDLLWSQQRQWQEEMVNKQASYGIKTAVDAATANTIASRIADPRVCSEIPQRVAGKMAGGGGYGAKRAAASVAKVVAENQIGTKPNEAAYASDLVRDHGSESSKTCTDEDVKYTGPAASMYGETRNRFGCTKAGTMPDGDVRAQSIFVPAVDYTKVAKSDPDETAKSMSMTFNQEQSLVAEKAIKNGIAAFSPPAMPKDVEGSAPGRMLLAKQLVYKARVSAAETAMAAIKVDRDPSNDLNKDSSIIQNWKNVARPVYEAVYGPIFARKYLPDVPSAAEFLRFEVVRRVFDTTSDNNWQNELAKDDNTARIARMQAETEALQLYTLQKILHRLEEGNAVQAAILAQMINPVTKDELQAAVGGAYRAGK